MRGVRKRLPADIPRGSENKECTICGVRDYSHRMRFDNEGRWVCSGCRKYGWVTATDLHRANDERRAANLAAYPGGPLEASGDPLETLRIPDYFLNGGS
jgi:hypothetical protein